MSILEQVSVDGVDWDAITPESLQRDVKWVYEQYEQKLAGIEYEAPENPLLFYQELIIIPERVFDIASSINDLRGDLGYKECDALSRKLSVALRTKIYYSERLKQLLLDYYPQNAEETRFKQLHIRKFRKQPQELLDEYEKLSLAYKDVLKDDTVNNKLTLEYKDEYVEGLDATFINYIKKENQLVLDSQYYCYKNIMSYCASAYVREQYWRFYQGKCMGNTKNAEEYLLIKKKIGEAYDYPSICELNLEERMAATVENVENFLKYLRDEVWGKYNNDIKMLTERYQLPAMKPWDLNYYAEKYREETCQLRSRDFDKYFEYGLLIRRLVRFLEELYKVEIKEAKLTKWHESVLSYEILQGGKRIARWYIDLIYRDYKRSGACMSTIGPRTFLVMCNFPPVPERGRHLISIDDVNTLLHECGHCFHAVMSKTTLEALASPDVFWDFVEVPSQFFENFIYDVHVMYQLGIDEDGNPVPTELLEKNKKRSKCLASLFIMRQLYFCWMDLSLHRNTEWNQVEVAGGESKIDKYLDTYMKGWTYDYGIPCKQIWRHFSHIFTSVYGYTCGYYSYLWADVIQAHMFEHYKKSGDFQAYVDKVLAMGNSKDPNELVYDYCGGFSFDAFKRLYGLDS